MFVGSFENDRKKKVNCIFWARGQNRSTLTATHSPLFCLACCRSAANMISTETIPLSRKQSELVATWLGVLFAFIAFVSFAKQHMKVVFPAGTSQYHLELLFPLPRLTLKLTSSRVRSYVCSRTFPFGRV